MKTSVPRIAARALAALAVLAVVGLAVLLWRGSEPGGIEDAWAWIVGPADLGPVEFSTLERRRSPNDALACPPEVCPRAASDMAPPVFAVAQERLRAIVAQAALAEPDTQLLFSARWESQDRYLARTPLMRFPDTIDVLIVARGEGRSTLAIYSRSQIGFSDLGANRARVERWLQRIGDRAARG